MALRSLDEGRSVECGLPADDILAIGGEHPSGDGSLELATLLRRLLLVHRDPVSVDEVADRA